jgi:ankyrin repeat protein
MNLSYSLFVESYKKGDIQNLQTLIEKYATEIHLQFAVLDGYTEIVRLLLCKKNIRIYYTTFQHACDKGYLDIVKVLLSDKRFDPSDEMNKAIRDACKNGYTEIVKILIKYSRVDVLDDESQALINAC